MTKPTKPYCATSGGCSQWEIDSYKRQVNTYFDSLKEYADGVDRYYKRAGEYIDCMSKLD